MKKLGEILQDIYGDAQRERETLDAEIIEEIMEADREDRVIQESDLMCPSCHEDKCYKCNGTRLDLATGKNRACQCYYQNKPAHTRDMSRPWAHLI